MSLAFDQETNRIIDVPDLVDDWPKWIFVRKDSAERNGIWPYCDPKLAETELKCLVEPIKPLITTFHPGATRLSDFSTSEEENYKWEYRRWKRSFTEWEDLSQAMRDFNCEISTSVARKYISLLWDKPSPHERLVVLHNYITLGANLYSIDYSNGKVISLFGELSF